MKSHILKAIQDDPTILDATPRRQLRALIINPFKQFDNPHHLPGIVVMDALDECDFGGRLATDLLFVACELQHYRYPIRFIITNRAECNIAAALTSSSFRCQLDDVDYDSDIRRFLRVRLNEIRERSSHVLPNEPWPSEEELDSLVALSDGLFISASLIATFIDNNAIGDPALTLQNFLSRFDCSKGSTLDRLYTNIISSSHYDESTASIVRNIICLRDPLPISGLARLLHVDEGHIRHALRGVSSLFRLPEDNSHRIRLVHASLFDYLTDQSRSGKYFVDSEGGHASIASCCIRLMRRHLKRDICNQEDLWMLSPWMLTRELDPLKFERTGGALRYACRFWDTHLLQSVREFEHLDLKDLDDFACRSLLYWIEVLSTLGEMSNASQTLERITMQLQVSALYRLSDGTDKLLLLSRT